ncbi:hypothetical protein DIPPA_35199 [Diplonema papillatum]|nr:hypothetical protein DIPPA_35199 [Diplonema papillatum]
MREARLINGAFCFLVLFSFPAFAGVPQIPDTVATLNAINELRAKHCSPDLIWSTELADLMAVNSSMKCLTKSESTDSAVLDELLVAELYSTTDAVAGGDIDKATQFFISFWYKSGNSYDYQNPGPKSDWDTFTQLVWENTTEVACLSCDMTQDSYHTACWFRYPGNEKGLYADNVKPVSTPAQCNPTIPPDTSSPPTIPPTQAPETQPPSTNAPSTDAPPSDVPGTRAPETTHPSTFPPDTTFPQTEQPSVAPPSSSPPDTPPAPAVTPTYPPTPFPDTKPPTTPTPQTKPTQAPGSPPQGPSTPHPLSPAPALGSPAIEFYWVALGFKFRGEYPKDVQGQITWVWKLANTLRGAWRYLPDPPFELIVKYVCPLVGESKPTGTEAEKLCFTPLAAWSGAAGAFRRTADPLAESQLELAELILKGDGVFVEFMLVDSTRPKLDTEVATISSALQQASEREGPVYVEEPGATKLIVNTMPFDNGECCVVTQRGPPNSKWSPPVDFDEPSEAGDRPYWWAVLLAGGLAVGGLLAMGALLVVKKQKADDAQRLAFTVSDFYRTMPENFFSGPIPEEHYCTTGRDDGDTSSFEMSSLGGRSLNGFGYVQPVGRI